MNNHAQAIALVPGKHQGDRFSYNIPLYGKHSSMIPTPQTGKMKKLDQATFRGEGWQLVTDNQALQSILKAINLKNDDYRCLYVLTGVDDTVAPASLLEVWAGWHKVPRNGSIFVCLYDRGKAYPDQGQEVS